MKKIMILTLIALAFGASELQAQTYVNGYYKSDGTYVQPHYRSNPNSTTLDNWSTKGNINPYTGEKGTKSAYPSYTSPSYNNNRRSSSSSTDRWFSY